MNWFTYCADLLFKFVEKIKPCEVGFFICDKPYGCQIHMAIRRNGADHSTVKLSFRIAKDEDMEYFKWFLHMFRQLDLHLNDTDSN